MQRFRSQVCSGVAYTHLRMHLPSPAGAHLPECSHSIEGFHHLWVWGRHATLRTCCPSASDADTEASMQAAVQPSRFARLPLLMWNAGELYSETNLSFQTLCGRAVTNGHGHVALITAVDNFGQGFRAWPHPFTCSLQGHGLTSIVACGTGLIRQVGTTNSLARDRGPARPCRRSWNWRPSPERSVVHLH